LDLIDLLFVRLQVHQFLSLLYLRFCADNLRTRQQHSTILTQRKEIEEFEKAVAKLEAERNTIIADMSDAAQTDRKHVLVKEKGDQIRKRRDKIVEIMDDHRTSFASFLGCAPQQVSQWFFVWVLCLTCSCDDFCILLFLVSCYS
jgi:hypothetical protein